MNSNIYIRGLIILLYIFSGILIGILLGESLKGKGIQILLGIALFLIAAGIYSAVRIYIVRQRRTLKSLEEIKEKSEVGFVVDTFQELLGRLKEKERELEQLISLTEDRARRIESYNENILQSVPSGVMTLDTSMKVKSINQAGERILNIKAEDVIEKDCSAVLGEPLIGLIENGKTLLRVEHPYLSRDGRHIWLDVTTSQLRNPSGEVIGLILIFTDITEVKTLQTQIELRERLTQLGEMSAGIAHELRNPMSVIAGYARLLSKRVEGSNKATADSILREIEGMDRIISELLAFAKPTEIQRSPVDIKRMVEDVLRAVVAGNTIDVSVNVDDSITINADPLLLRQALTNILQNAVEAMPQGGRIEIGLNLSHGMAHINIRDTGCGIPEDIRQKIFLPFYTTKGKGTGLGLALVQKIVVSHGGSIDVESKEGEETVFRITLPLV